MPKARKVELSDHLMENCVSRETRSQTAKLRVEISTFPSLPLELLENIVMRIKNIKTLLSISDSCKVLQRLAHLTQRWLRFSDEFQKVEPTPIKRDENMKSKETEMVTLSLVIRRYLRASRLNPCYNFNVDEVMELFISSVCQRCENDSKSTKAYWVFDLRLCRSCLSRICLQEGDIEEDHIISGSNEPPYELIEQSKFYLRADLINCAYNALSECNYGAKEYIHRQIQIFKHYDTMVKETK